MTEIHLLGGRTSTLRYPKVRIADQLRAAHRYLNRSHDDRDEQSEERPAEECSQRTGGFGISWKNAPTESYDYVRGDQRSNSASAAEQPDRNRRPQ